MKARGVLVLTLGLAASGCTGGRGREVALSDSLSPDRQLAPADTLAPEPLPEPTQTLPAADAGGERQSGAGARLGAAAAPRSHRPTPRTSDRPTQAPKPARVASAPATSRPRGYAPVAGGVDTTNTRLPGDSTAPNSPPETTASKATKRATDTAFAVGADSALPPATAPSAQPATGPAPTAPTDSVTEATADSAPAPSTAATSTAAPSAPSSALPAGTEFRAQLQDSINSLRNSAGQVVTALVSGDVRAPDGRTVLPSGSTVYVYIARLRPARTRSAKDGELELRVDSVTANGRSYPVHADVGPVPHELRGRGVTAGEVEKVGAGAAAGAVVGGVITGKTKGAVIGGAVGAAGGAVVAAQTASRDVVVTPGTLLTLVLREPVARMDR
jgi:hypothetical protein